MKSLKQWLSARWDGYRRISDETDQEIKRRQVPYTGPPRSRRDRIIGIAFLVFMIALLCLIGHFIGAGNMDGH